MRHKNTWEFFKANSIGLEKKLHKKTGEKKKKTKKRQLGREQRTFNEAKYQTVNYTSKQRNNL